MSNQADTSFKRFAIPLVEVLRELGGSARPAEATDLVLEKLDISEDEQSEVLKDGTSKVRNQVAWARYYWVQAGYIDSSKYGVWTLTEQDQHDNFKNEDVERLFKKVDKESYERKKQKEVGESDDEAPDSSPESDYRSRLLDLLKGLPPSGFERLCQRLLRESGFQQVHVTGKSGDGGIDGHGILQINPLVSFKVLFQCKRYQGAVAVSTSRDVRGAMQGRADKGIIITTGNFTTDAKGEATRDGAPPVELVDGDKLVEMFEKLGLGLVPKKDFDVDETFFDQFRDKQQKNT